MKYDGLVIGIKLMELRKQKGWTREGLSEKSGLSVSMITQLELGGRKLSIKSLYIYMNIFSCDANTILNIRNNEENSLSIDVLIHSLPEKFRNDFIKFFAKIIEGFQEVCHEK